MDPDHPLSSVNGAKRTVARTGEIQDLVNYPPPKRVIVLVGVGDRYSVGVGVPVAVVVAVGIIVSV
jgi:hypothetical protein